MQNLRDAFGLLEDYYEAFLPHLHMIQCIPGAEADWPSVQLKARLSDSVYEIWPLVTQFA